MKDEEMTLLLRSFDEELAPHARKRLDDLLETSAEMRDERGRLTHLRALLAGSRATSFSAGFTDRVLEVALPRPRRPSFFRWMDPAGKRGTRRGARRRVASPWRLVAGLAAAVLAVGVALWMQPLTVAVPHGEADTVTLSDGSSVELSGGSSLIYRRYLGRSERRVELSGEAFFDVTAGERPFVVETFNADIRVLGTRFNVRAWPDERVTNVALAEGRVSVEPRRAPREQGQTLAAQRLVVLEPGEGTTVGADSAAAVRPISLDRVLAWRSGGLAFADQPLASVFRSIERRFGVRVTAADAAIMQEKVTYLNPAPSSTAEVLSDICHTLDLRFRRTSDGFEVFTPPARDR